MANVNINPNPKRSRSQKARILEYLQSGGRLTPYDAIKFRFGTKLATRVSELINKDGHDEIKKEMLKIKVWNDEEKKYERVQVMSYYIEREAV